MAYWTEDYVETTSRPGEPARRGVVPYDDVLGQAAGGGRCRQFSDLPDDWDRNDSTAPVEDDVRCGGSGGIPGEDGDAHVVLIAR